jgi:hypothetical protein
MPEITSYTKEFFDVELKLSRDLLNAAKTLSPREVRYMVDSYYQIQEDRKRSANQIRKMSEGGEPHELLRWFNERSDRIEQQIKRALKAYAESQALGQWAMSIVGIGPVISAGLMAHIDITKAPTVGHIWSFAGLDPRVAWEKKEKRPWNARLKSLCFLIGESFVKTSNHEKSFYGRIYRERKDLELQRNAELAFKEQAQAKLEKFNIGKDTDAYKAYSIGQLPPAHLHARARRYTVKLFLSHYHDKAYRLHFGQAPPQPFAIALLHHGHYIPCPE